jgi:hypothetical protein
MREGMEPGSAPSASYFHFSFSRLPAYEDEKNSHKLGTFPGLS